MGKNHDPVVTITVGTALRDAEKAVIQATLAYTGGNISAAAKILGVDRCTLYAKIDKYKIPRSERALPV